MLRQENAALLVIQNKYFDSISSYSIFASCAKQHSQEQ